MGRRDTTDKILKGFLLLDKKEKQQGFRETPGGYSKMPLNGNQNYIYDGSNDLTGEKGGRISKSANLTSQVSASNIGAFAQDRIMRERAARIAEQKYLGVENPYEKSSQEIIYTPESARAVDNVRQNQAGNIIIPKEFLETMKELVKTNKILKSEIDAIKEQKSEKRIIKSFSAPKSMMVKRKK